MLPSTEAESPHPHLEQLSTLQLVQALNTADHQVAPAVQRALPQVVALVNAALGRMQAGGRLFYLGAGTSGRLGIVDASECPPTFGVAPGLVVGLIAGGDGAIRQAVEFAEDDPLQAWQDLKPFNPTPTDTLIGLSASGSTPYVLGGVQLAAKAGLLTGCVVCNAASPLAAAVAMPIEVIVGPEVLTGSTRLKAGTAQKMLLNMISTALMVGLGHVVGNKMIDMQLSNRKLIERGTRYLMQATGLSPTQAEALLVAHGSLRAALQAYHDKAQG